MADGVLVWAQGPGFPWWPAVLLKNGLRDVPVPWVRSILDAIKDRVAKGASHSPSDAAVLCFYSGHKYAWAHQCRSQPFDLALEAPFREAMARFPRHKKHKRRWERAVKDAKADDAACAVCARATDPDMLLLCDRCDAPYHCGCLTPPLSAVPAGRWYCSQCHTRKSRKSDDSSRPAKRRARNPVSSSRTLNLTRPAEAPSPSSLFPVRSVPCAAVSAASQSSRAADAEPTAATTARAVRQPALEVVRPSSGAPQMPHQSPAPNPIGSGGRQAHCTSPSPQCHRPVDRPPSRDHSPSSTDPRDRLTSQPLTAQPQGGGLANSQPCAAGTSTTVVHPQDLQHVSSALRCAEMEAEAVVGKEHLDSLHVELSQPSLRGPPRRRSFLGGFPLPMSPERHFPDRPVSDAFAF